MLTDSELKQIENDVTPENMIKLVTEVERLRNYIHEYNHSISQKVDELEKNMFLLEEENSRLLTVKSIGFIERDACIGLLTQLAIAHPLKAGVAPGNVVVIELPNGQVSWEFAESEAHLFSHLPPYSGSIEDLSIEEKYRRVMNPGIKLEQTST